MTDRIPPEARLSVQKGSVRSSRRTTPSKRRGSLAPASRALVAGLSLSATTAIVAALALSGQQSATSFPQTIELDVTGVSGANGQSNLGLAGASVDPAAIPASGTAPTPTPSVPSSAAPAPGAVASVGSVSMNSGPSSSAAVAPPVSTDVRVLPAPVATAPPVAAAPVTTAPAAPTTTVTSAPRTRAS